ncbi:hypothetical protein CC86DRAFT_428838 [Ophiobolus disseminans]|uniref:Uncharacterized protein n=1 Tax=Ophiobolus disseminans TaxID=1469910 RepID=A0A6A6ZJ25_9PLEO|nr:hypothetical protein CC86DRAFT_428838 [Ophiobolus disseminans]
MWNGHEIIRLHGAPTIIQIVLAYQYGVFIAYTLRAALDFNILVDASSHQKAVKDVHYPDNVFSGAPNLIFNIPGLKLRDGELRTWAFVGIILQGTATAAPAIISHSTGVGLSSYGYVYYAIGTVTVCIRLALCSHIIKGSTSELELVANPADPSPLQIITL